MGLGKSFKKAFKKVAKVATLGATGKGGWGSKAIGALSGGLVGDSSVYGSSGGLGAFTGNNSALEDQQRMAARQAEQQAALAAQQAIFQSNMSKDLSRDNITNVVTGGSAMASDMLFDTSKKKRNAGALSATLGIG